MSVSAPTQERIAAQAHLAAWASVRVPYAGVEALRAQPSPTNGRTLPPRFLKNSDEQTVAGIAALLRAIDKQGWIDRAFTDWAVLGAPRFLGRLIVSGVINRTIADPAYSVSPHIIPNQCLHSLSGAISVGLGIHGPNYGVGGGPGAVAEALLAGLTLLREGRVPGVWIVASAGDPEPIPDQEGKPTNDFDLVAVALALTSKRDGRRLLRLELDSSVASGSECMIPMLIQRLESASESTVCNIAGLGYIGLGAEAKTT